MTRIEHRLRVLCGSEIQEFYFSRKPDRQIHNSSFAAWILRAVAKVTIDHEALMYSNTILLVQPQTDSSTYLRARLEDKGYVVVEASDTATAMNVVKGSEIALVVTELYLRHGKSRCLARVIGRSPAVRRTKLLAYTTHGKRADRDWAREIGADGYVITRSGEERFLSVVDHLMVAPSVPRRTRRSSQRTRRPDIGTPPSTDA